MVLVFGGHRHRDHRGPQHPPVQQVAAPGLVRDRHLGQVRALHARHRLVAARIERLAHRGERGQAELLEHAQQLPLDQLHAGRDRGGRLRDRKSTRLNSSHLVISYAVFCLKKKKKKKIKKIKKKKKKKKKKNKKRKKKK